MADLPNIRAVLNTLPPVTQTMVRAWLVRGVPIAVKRVVESPQLLLAVIRDLPTDQHTS